MSSGVAAMVQSSNGEASGRRTRLDITVELMLWSIIILLLILWALGFGFHVAGGLIHLLLVVALVVLVFRLVSGGRVP
jgi:hypothetical protein